MFISQTFVFFIFLSVLSADDNFKLNDETSADENKYVRSISNSEVYDGVELHDRIRRQANAEYNKTYYVTQCGYDNLEKPNGPSIQVLGRFLKFENATRQAARLVHLLVRFMPRPLFLKIVEMNTIGLYPSSKLPEAVFDEFNERPPACRGGRCGFQFQGNGVVDCSTWCTFAGYPYQQNYPINYLWAYGNFSKLYVVESNVVCDGFNPTGSESLLIREFGLMLLARILDSQTVMDVVDAYETAVTNGTWEEMKNEYEYFMVGTLAWFNGVHFSSRLKGLACVNIFGNNGLPLCSDAFGQRQYIKEKDIKLYKILNYVYNNNREYVNAETSLCPPEKS